MVRAREDGPRFETYHLMCMVCGALPGTTCIDEDFAELRQVHPSRWLTIAERNWKTANGWEPPELVARRQRKAKQARRDARRAAREPASTSSRMAEWWASGTPSAHHRPPC